MVCKNLHWPDFYLRDKERRRVQDMVIGRLVRSKEDLTIENRDLKSKLGLVAGICRGFTETETANQGHMINRDTQASIDSNMEGRARKRTRQATANRLQNRLSLECNTLEFNDLAPLISPTIYPVIVLPSS